MNLHDFRIFLSAAEQLHFGKASRQCNLSASALSRAIQRLEEELGQPLFTRDNRNVVLTPSGERFKRYAIQSLQEWSTLSNDLRNEQEVSGAISIYASITAVYSLLPDLIEAYRIVHPNVHLELQTGAAEQALDLVLNNETDVAVAPLPDSTSKQLCFLPLTKIPLVFIAPRTGEQAQPYRTNGQLDLARTPLVLPGSGLSRSRLDQWMKRKSILPNINSEVSGNEALIAMVRLGCGVGIVPKLVLERSPFFNDVQILSRAPKLEPYIVGLCTTKRTLTHPAVKALWNLAKQSQKKNGLSTKEPVLQRTKKEWK